MQKFGISGVGDLEKMGANVKRTAQIQTFMNVPLIVFGVYAGIELWKKRPRGVLLAKRFLIAFGIVSILGRVLLPRALGLASKGSAAIPPLLIAAAWYIYLTRSRRVRQTYGTAGAA